LGKKKILEWTANPIHALKIAHTLNDKYLLDSRDPQGYTGCAWAIGGLYDQLWKDRAVFGKIRYMNTSSLKRKFKVDQYIKHLKGFMETEAKDTYKGKIKSTALGVINMDNSNGPGTHFTCFFNHPNKEYVYYYDSYGIVPPTLIKKFLLSSGKIIAYNTTQFQPINSSLCGYYCIYVLHKLAQGHSFNDTLLLFSYDTIKNDNMIMNFFKLSRSQSGKGGADDDSSNLLGNLISGAIDILPEVLPLLL